MVSSTPPFVRDHYYLKHPKVIEEINFDGRIFLSKYEYINAPLSDKLIEKHREHKLIIATSIPADANYFVIDYNGDDSARFYHKARKVLHAASLEDFEAFESKTASHLHLYVYCDAVSAPQREELGKIISQKLEEKLQKQWRIFPNSSLPEAYNILNIPYQHYKVEL